MTQHPAEPPAPHRADGSATAARAARSGPSTGRLVAVVVVLAGLFGMHGLAGHGSHGADTSMGMGDSTVAMTAVATTEVVVGAGHDVAMVSAHASPAVSSKARATQSLASAVSGGLSGGAMSMLCLAVLTAGMFLLLLVLRRPRVVLARVPAPVAFAPLGWGRDRDPPSLTVLSIRRC